MAGQPGSSRQRIAEDYIQHSAAGNPESGAAEALTMLKQMPKSRNPPKPFMRIIADGDYIVLHMLITLRPSMIVLDMVRLKNARFAEHWDAIQPMSGLPHIPPSKAQPNHDLARPRPTNSG